MAVAVVLVHGIRTSRTMWRAQEQYLTDRGNPVTAVDLPGHGSRMSETFSLEGAFATIDDAVRQAADEHGTVLLAAHSMGGLLSIEYAGQENPPPIAGFIAASCTAIPRGTALQTYRLLARGFDSLPDRGAWLSERVLDATLPPETRADFGAGGYALDAQDTALRSLSVLDLLSALGRIEVPLWFVNGQFDQLRVNERLFTRVAPDAELSTTIAHFGGTTRTAGCRTDRCAADESLGYGHASSRVQRGPEPCAHDPRTDLVDSLIGLCVGFTLTIAGGRPSLVAGSPSITRTKERLHVANIKSQIKRNKTNEKARERNKAVKSALKTEVRRTREAIAAGDKAAAEKALATATKKLDKAVSKGVIHANQAANRKSAISKQVAAL